MDVDAMKVTELKRELRSRSLPTSGRKAELQNRLRTALNAENENDDNNAAMNDFDHDQFEVFLANESKRLNIKSSSSNDDDNDNNNDDNDDDDDDLVHQIQLQQEQEALMAAAQQQEPHPADHPDFIDEDEEKNIMAEEALLSTLQMEQTTTETLTVTATVETIKGDDDPTALNATTKIQEREKRFGALAQTETEKIESRKRRFASTLQPQQQPPSKKQKIVAMNVNNLSKDDREKLLKRSQKFGTALPKNLKLTKEELNIVHKEKIERAQRFGTSHLLPKSMQKAEFEEKKAKRKERFAQKDENGNVIDNKPVSSRNIIKAKPENAASLKLMERKLRFGTLTDVEKIHQRQEKFGTKSTLMQNKKKSFNGNQNQNKKFSNRQWRDNQKFQRFRQFKKFNKQNRFNNNGNNGGGYNAKRFTTKVQFSSDDQKAIEARKQRFINQDL